MIRYLFIILCFVLLASDVDAQTSAGKKISQLPSGGTVQSTDLFPIIRPPSPGANCATTQCQDLAVTINPTPTGVTPVANGGTGNAIGGAVYLATGFNIKCDGATDDTLAFNTALSAINTAGGGVLALPGNGQSCIVCGVVQPSFTTIDGGYWGGSTELKVKNSCTTYGVASKNFSVLTGTDTHTGVPQMIGLRNLRINGNGANAASSLYNVAYYAHGIDMQHMIFYGAKTTALWTESDSGTGSSVTWPPGNPPSVPEGYFDDMQIFGAGGDGWDCAGPYDIDIGSVITHNNAGWGFITSNVCGIDHLGLMHSYGNITGGQKYQTYVRADKIMVDFDNLLMANGSSNSIINDLKLYNCVSGFPHCAEVTTQDVQIGHIDGFTGSTTTGNTMLYWSGVNGRINAGTFNANANGTANNIGLDIENDALQAKNLTFENFTGSGNVCLKYGVVGYSNVQGYTNNCTTGMTYAGYGFNNLNLNLRTQSGQTTWTHSASNTSDSLNLQYSGADSGGIVAPAQVVGLGTQTVRNGALLDAQGTINVTDAYLVPYADGVIRTAGFFFNKVMGIVFQSGQDTLELYAPGSNVGTDANPVMYLLGNQSVGIGTGTPSLNALAVNGSAAVGTYGGTGMSAPTSGLIVSGFTGIGTAAPQQQFQVQGNALVTGAIGLGTTTLLGGAALTSAGSIAVPYANPFLVSQGNFAHNNIMGEAFMNGHDTIIISAAGAAAEDANPIMYLQGNGAVGIGTATPFMALDVNGTARANLFSGSGASLTGIGTTNMTAVTGTANSTTFLRGDNVWGTVSGGGSGIVTSSTAGQIAYYQSTGSTVIGTSSVTLSGTNLSVAGSITPGAGIVGVGTSTAAPAGVYGQVFSSVGSLANCPSSGNWGDITSINLTAGNWLVSGQVIAALNGSTSVQFAVGISTTSGNSSTGLVTGDNLLGLSVPGSATGSSASIVDYQMLLAAPTTVYLKDQCTYSPGTPQMAGRITAHRIY